MVTRQRGEWLVKRGNVYKQRYTVQHLSAWKIVLYSPPNYHRMYRFSASICSVIGFWAVSVLVCPFFQRRILFTCMMLPRHSDAKNKAMLQFVMSAPHLNCGHRCRIMCLVLISPVHGILSQPFAPCRRAGIWYYRSWIILTK